MFQKNHIMTHYVINFVHKKISTGECCLGSHCVSSWSLYGLKRGIPWQFVFGFSLFLLILCLPINENHEHVQSWNPTTTKSLPGRHNNNKNRENKQQIRKKWFGWWAPNPEHFYGFNEQTGRHKINVNKTKMFVVSWENVCCLGELCVISQSSYGIKQGIHRQFIFVFSMFLLVLCLPVHENH